jgi:hypothetical protein
MDRPSDDALANARWFVLGFTDDQVVGAWQDWRLARDCVRAWEAAGRPHPFEVLQMAGTGPHFLRWFVHEAAARILDDQGVSWREFLTGECATPPSGARDALIFAAEGEPAVAAKRWTLDVGDGSRPPLGKRR